MIISQLSIAPIGKQISVSKYVKIVIDVLEKNNINYQINDMSTVIETKNLDKLFNVVKKAHEAVLNTGIKRVITELKIDDRKDKNVFLGSKIKSVE